MFPTRTKPEGYAHRKYRPGPKITTIDAIADCCIRGSWIWDFARNKAVHPSWIANLGVWMAYSYVRAGRLGLALRNKTRPLVFTATTWSPFLAPSVWLANCSEIPCWSCESNNEQWLVENCTSEARRRGHHGPVRVDFQRDA